MNFASQPDMVRASLLMEDQRTHRHDAPTSRRRVTDGQQQQHEHRVSAVLLRTTASHAPENTHAGHHGGSPGPARICEHCNGKGHRTDLNGAAWKCSMCHGSGLLRNVDAPAHVCPHRTHGCGERLCSKCILDIWRRTT